MMEKNNTARKDSLLILSFWKPTGCQRRQHFIINAFCAMILLVDQFHYLPYFFAGISTIDRTGEHAMIANLDQ